MAHEFIMKASAGQIAVRNANARDVSELVTIALLCAIDVVLSFVGFSLLPGTSFLKLDASLVPAMVCGFAYGPACGIAVGMVGALINGIFFADFVGCVMNIMVVFGFVLPSAIVRKRSRTFKAVVASLALGVVGATAMAIAGNLVLTPAYMGVPLQAVVDMIIPVFLPFNLIKAVINSALTLAVCKSISNLITPKES